MAVVAQPLLSGDPQKVGPYRLRGRLGAGGMGIVYLAEDRQGHLVAIKRVRFEFASDQTFRARFKREVDLARRVDAAFTARVLDADPNDEYPYLVTEYVDGPTLLEAVQDSGPLQPPQLRALAIGLAAALAALHADGLVHRDVKPSNVLLGPRGPLLIDFGIASAAEATSLTLTGAVSGSPAWMAPEQAEGRGTTPRTDVFGWGASIAFGGIGAHPFGEGRPEAVLYRIVHGSPTLDGLDPVVRHWVERALNRQDSGRPSMDEVIRGISQVTELGSPATERTLVAAVDDTWLQPPARPQPPQPARKRVRRRRLAPLFGAAVLLAAAAAAWAVTSASEEGDDRSLRTAAASEPSTTAPSQTTTAAPTTAAPTTTVKPPTAAEALAEIVRSHGSTAVSPVVPQPSGDVAAVAYGQGMLVLKYLDGSWQTRATISLPLPVVDRAIETSDVTGDGQPEFLVFMSGADALAGSVITAHHDRWEIAHFINDSGILMDWVPDPTIEGGGMLTTEHDCDPNCAEGFSYTQPWLYDESEGYFYKNFGPGTPGGAGE